MSLKIMPHGRLQEWVAEEKGFFTAAGLDYTFLLNSGAYGIHPVPRAEGGAVGWGARARPGVPRGPRSRQPGALAGLSSGGGYPSASPFATVQALEGVLGPD